MCIKGYLEVTDVPSVGNSMFGCVQGNEDKLVRTSPVVRVEQPQDDFYLVETRSGSLYSVKLYELK